MIRRARLLLSLFGHCVQVPDGGCWLPVHPLWGGVFQGAAQGPSRGDLV